MIDTERAEIIAIRKEEGGKEKTTFKVQKPPSMEKIKSNKSIPQQMKSGFSKILADKQFIIFRKRTPKTGF